MPRRDALVDVLSDFARALLSDVPVTELLDEVVHHAVDLLPIDSAGITLIAGRGSADRISASDEAATSYSQLQDELDEGPCLEAYRTEHPVLSPDLTRETRFPAFAAQAARHGLRAAFSFPLLSAQRRIGALDLYRDHTGDLCEQDVAVATTLAHVATAYLLSAEARTARADFVASVSHELRTPMTAIRGYGELLDDAETGPLNPTQRDFLDAIRRNADRAEALAGDLLIVASLDSGAERRPLVVDLLDVARTAQESLGPTITQSAVRVDFDYPDEPVEPVRVVGVTEDLVRVVVNLITNAIKFTARRPPWPTACRATSRR